MKKFFWCGFFILLCIIGCWFLFRPEREAEADSLYHVYAQIKLGQVEVKNFKSMGFTHGEMSFSPDGTKLALGSEDGKFFMYDLAKKKIIWRKSLGIGRVTSLLFSPEGELIYLGETSPEGKIYCLNAASGKEIWQASVLPELGHDLAKKLYPQVISLCLDQKNHLFVSGLRFDRIKKKLKYNSRIYCLAADTGKKIWLYPKTHNADFWVGHMSLLDNGKKLILGTSNYTPGRRAKYNQHLYTVDVLNGNLLWAKTFDILPDENNVNIRSGPQVSEDTHKMVIFPSDGRLYCLDSSGKVLWMKHICQSKEVQGVRLNSGGRYAYWLGGQVIAGTGNTFDNGNWQLPTPIEHPNGNTLFAYDALGKLLWRWKAGGALEKMDYNRSYIWMPVGRNNQSEDFSVHGGYLIDYNAQGKEVYYYQTEGPGIVGAVSPDSQYLALLEAPIQLDDGVTVLGEHKLHILERSQKK